MSTYSTTYNINFDYNGEQVFSDIKKGFDAVDNATKKATKSFGDCFESLLSFSLALDGIEQLENGLTNLLQPGIDLNSQMADLSAITGLVGDGLDKVERSARESAKAFGTEATQNIESYKLILSQLSPDIAKNDKALAAMGDNVNILSKTMGGDTVAATNVLTTAMNQYGVALDDPIQASKVMGEMMNVMASGAKEGSAELPQIASALEQVGMMAKNANVSFEETNASIQVLDKAGKKGSEGGVALRNVLATLSQGRFLPKDTQLQLQNAGVDISRLTDLTIPLTQRLRGLAPIMSDNALVTKLFGKENSAAATALLQGVDIIDALKGKLTGTNTAVEQANTVMGSYAERMKRTSAWMNDLKISFFNTTASLMPYVQHTMSAVTSVGRLATSIHALSTVYNSFHGHLLPGIKLWWNNTIAVKVNTAYMYVATKISKVYSSAMKGVAKATGQATLATNVFSVSIMSIPVVGWIIAAITAIVIGLKLLWDHSKRFREILFGVWEAGKVVFHNIGIVIKRVYNVFVKPVLKSIWDTFKKHFNFIKTLVTVVWNSIANGLSWLWNSVIQPTVSFISNAFSVAFNYAWDTVSSFWSYLTKTFSSFTGLVNQFIINPMRDAFSGIWKWIVELLDNLFNKISGILAPIKKLWNAIFSTEGMTDIEIAYKEGEKKGTESYDNDHAENQKDNTPLAVSKITGVTPTKTIGAKAVNTINTNNKSTSSTNENRVSTLTVNKLVEKIEIINHNANLTKHKLKQLIDEALLTAVADFTAIN